MRPNESLVNVPLEAEAVDSSEAKWVYSMSAPREEGQPDFQFVIGEPLKHTNKYASLLPLRHGVPYHIWDINLPLNIVVDGQKIECIVMGQIMNRECIFIIIIADTNPLPKGVDADDIIKAYERQMRPGISVYDALKQEFGRQCLKYFDIQILDDIASTRDKIDRAVDW